MSSDFRMNIDDHKYRSLTPDEVHFCETGLKSLGKRIFEINKLVSTFLNPLFLISSVAFFYGAWKLYGVYVGYAFLYGFALLSGLFAIRVFLFDEVLKSSALRQSIKQRNIRFTQNHQGMLSDNDLVILDALAGVGHDHLHPDLRFIKIYAPHYNEYMYVVFGIKSHSLRIIAPNRAGYMPIVFLDKKGELLGTASPSLKASNHPGINHYESYVALPDLKDNPPHTALCMFADVHDCNLSGQIQPDAKLPVILQLENLHDPQELSLSYYKDKEQFEADKSTHLLLNANTNEISSRVDDATAKWKLECNVAEYDKRQKKKRRDRLFNVLYFLIFGPLCLLILHLKPSMNSFAFSIPFVIAAYLLFEQIFYTIAKTYRISPLSFKQTNLETGETKTTFSLAYDVIIFAICATINLHALTWDVIEHYLTDINQSDLIIRFFNSALYVGGFALFYGVDRIFSTLCDQYVRKHNAKPEDDIKDIDEMEELDDEAHKHQD